MPRFGFYKFKDRNDIFEWKEYGDLFYKGKGLKRIK